VEEMTDDLPVLALRSLSLKEAEEEGGVGMLVVAH
jgi:hypothetical protein